MRQMIDFRDHLIEKFSDIDKALSFLEVLLEEHEKEPDSAALYYGFSAAVEAQGGVQKFALKTHSPPQAVSDALLSKDETQIAELLKKQVLAKRGKDKDIAQNEPLPACTPADRPKGWREMQLGEVCSIDNRTLSSKTPEDYCFDYIALSDIDRGHLLQTTHYKFSEAPSRARRIVKKGDVLLATVRPNLQGFYIFKDEIEDCIVSTGFAVLTPIPDLLDSVYLFQILFSHRMLATYYAVNVGSNYPAINSSDISKFKIPIPSLSEQKAIASLLEKWDTAIEKTEALIEAKKKRFKWLLKTLISDQQDNPEWQKMKLGEICTFEYGKPLKEQDRTGDRYPVFGSNGIVGSHNEYLVAGPFIVVGRKGSAGTVLYSVDNGFPIDTTFYINLQSEEIQLRFFYYLLLLVKLDRISAQSGVPGLNRNDAYKISISIPSFVEQRGITRTLDAVNLEIDLLKQLAEQYRIQKRGLMQKLLTGKWRIKKLKKTTST